jgi:hypothetical protein
MEKSLLTLRRRNKMGKHELHKQIGNIFKDLCPKHLKVHLDEACEGDNISVKKQLPFFFNKFDKTRSTQVSKVDIMIVKDNKIKLVCEIEESGFNPTKIFGKVFSTASAQICKLADNSQFELDSDGVFVQVISSKHFKQGLSKKPDQLDKIKDFIKATLNKNDMWIMDYYLLYGTEIDFEPNGTRYLELNKILNKIT